MSLDVWLYGKREAVECRCADCDNLQAWFSPSWEWYARAEDGDSDMAKAAERRERRDDDARAGGSGGA